MNLKHMAYLLKYDLMHEMSPDVRTMNYNSITLFMKECLYREFRPHAYP